ncbi:hypothetical protein JRO89_XS09G0136100 [Xanthoceras sorbifolium]|uniref:Transposase n=1 Tax=Xanthoceras sorbifolium TaxID=99658 RepID=A0ABQ8HL67_9ROSI|nr:hypothetical protein JRO89_XS09G0136100 [Xanthoceras sorbifolium]
MVSYMLKNLRNEHTCLEITKNRDADSSCLGKKFQDLIKENSQINIRVLHSMVLRTCGLDVSDHTLYRAQRYAIKRENEDHKVSYNKLYKYGHVIREMNPGSSVIMCTVDISPPTINVEHNIQPAARSSNAVDFEVAMGKIKETLLPAYNYLMQIPINQCSVHAFDQFCKSNHNTNNVVEAFNGWLNKIRTLSMLTMMEHIRRKIMKHIYRRYDIALKWETNIPLVITRQM